MNAAAMASIAGMEDWHARCLRENKARNRRARGSDSEVSVLRSVRMVGSVVGGGDVAEGAILPCCDWKCCCARCRGGGRIYLGTCTKKFTCDRGV